MTCKGAQEEAGIEKETEQSKTPASASFPVEVVERWHTGHGHLFGNEASSGIPPPVPPHSSEP